MKRINPYNNTQDGLLPAFKQSLPDRYPKKIKTVLFIRFIAAIGLAVCLHTTVAAQSIIPGVPSPYNGYQGDTTMQDSILVKEELTQVNLPVSDQRKTDISPRAYPTSNLHSHIPNSFSPDRNKITGQIPISEGTGPTGARTYNIPMKIASGSNGVQPELSISYNSMGGDGYLGRGWNIGGLSVIARSRQSIYYDGKTKGASNSTSDAFYLDGTRLIRTATTSSKNTYQSEQGNIKAEAYLSGSQVKYFKVYYPNGATAIMGYHGNTANKPVYPVTQVRDKDGNIIDYAYDHTYNSYRIKNIYYGKNGSKVHFASAHFTYTTRSDISFGWQNGVKSENRSLLASINCKDGSTVITTYTFSYTGQNNKLLQQVSCTVNGAELNPLKFYYGEGSQTATLEKKSTQLLSYFNSSTVKELDLKKGKFDAWDNDDGLIVRPVKNAYAEHRKSGGVFSGTKKWYENMMHPDQEILVYYMLADNWVHPQKVKAGRGFIDMFACNIDGKAGDEVVKARLYHNGRNDHIEFDVYRPAPVSSGAAIAKAFTRSYTAPTALDCHDAGSPHPRLFFPGDYNGDGRMEILAVSCDNPLELGAKSRCYLYDLHNNRLLFQGYAFDFKAGFGGETTTDALFPLDYDGDGKTDLCHINSGGTSIYSFTANGSQVNALTKVATYTELKNSSIKYHQLRVGEFNGDGKPDILLSPRESYTLTHNYTIPVSTPRFCNHCGAFDPVAMDMAAGGHYGGYSYFECKHCLNRLDPSQQCYQCGQSLQNNYNWDTGNYEMQCSGHGTMVDIQTSKYIDRGKNWEIYYSKGNGQFDKKTTAICNNNTGDKYELVDMNSDGTTDLVCSSKSGQIKIYPARKGVLSTSTLSGYAYVGSGAHLVPTNISRGNYHSKLLALKNDKIEKVAYSINETSQNLLTGAVGSYGVVSKTRYSQMNSETPGFYTEGYSAGFPYIDFNGPVLLVAETQSWANNKKLAHQTFSYQQALLHVQGLGLRGFKRIDAHDQLSGGYTYNHYDPVRFATLTKQETRKATVNNNYSVSVAANKTARVSLTSKSFTDKLKGNTITSSFQYDSYNNLKREYINYGGGMTTVITIDYNNNTSLSGYMLGVPSQKTVKKTANGNSFTEQTNWAYNSGSKGKPYSVTVRHNGLQVSRLTYSYDVFGNITGESVKKYSSPDLLETGYKYTPNGRFLEETTNPMGQKTTFARNARGQVASQENFKGHKTSYQYDALGRITEVLYPTGEKQSTAWLWDNTGGSYMYLVSKTSNIAPAQKEHYDAPGRILKSGHHGLNGWVYTYTEYDSRGRPYRTSLPATGSTKRWNTTAYDTYNRPVRITEASGAVTSYKYNANSVTVSKAGRSSTKTTNARGDLVSASDPGGTITYTCRGDGQPSRIIAPGNTETKLEYDSYGRQTKIIDPSAGTISYEYDAAGNINRQTNANNKLTSRIYDKYGRLTRETTPEFSTSYGYNTDHMPTGSTSNNGTKISYTYNNLLQLQTVSETVDGQTYSETYAYNNGRVSLVTYAPLGYKVSYQYNSSHHLAGMKNGSTTLWTLNSQDAFGNTTKQTYGNGVAVYSNFNTYGFPTQIKAKKGSTVLQHFGYSFNAETGNLNSRSDQRRNLTEAFGYDKLDRLTECTIQGNKLVTAYNANGNITSHPGAGEYDYQTPGKPYAISGIDNSGNAVPARAQSISYTGFGRPKKLSENGNTINYTYNAAYHRAKATSTINKVSTTVRSYASGKYQRIQKGSLLTQRLYLGGGPYRAFAVLEKTGSSSTKISYLHRDYLGSITMVSNSSGNRVAEYSYTAWGRMRNPANWQTYNTGSEPTPMFGRGYTGHEHLPAFGLINMNARLYDPAIGRFLSPDPYVQAPDFTQNFNRYSYCLNNPLVYTDPSGELSFLATLAIVWAGNYVIGWLDNVINKEMSPKDAFRNTSFVMGVNWAPADFNNKNYGVSHPQVDAHNEPKKEEETINKVNDELNNVRQEYGAEWMAATYGEIKPYNPSFWDSWSESNNFFGKITYDLVDGISVTAQSFVRGPKAQHLNGEQVSGYDRIDAFVNTVEWGLAAGELSSFKAIKGGFQSTRWGLQVQSHTHSLNPISGRGYSGAKAVSHFNLNKFHIIYNPNNWKGWSTYPYFPFRY